MARSGFQHFLAYLILFCSLFIAACSQVLPFFPTAIPSATASPTATPTATPIPMALTVNGEEITTIEFDDEVDRLVQARVELGQPIERPAAVELVQADMVDTLLLKQGAESYGTTLDDAMLQERIDALAAQLGGEEALQAWMTVHGYDQEGFRTALRRQVAAAWMRDQVLASVPAAAEQVHVQQILVFDSASAQRAYDLLETGWEFPDLAAQYDPLTRGELGWFPRGYLASLSIEEAAFSLKPGQYSQVIQDDTGYHILYLSERDPARQLSPDALLGLQERALLDWLTQRRNESTIILVP